MAVLKDEDVIKKSLNLDYNLGTFLKILCSITLMHQEAHVK